MEVTNMKKNFIIKNQITKVKVHDLEIEFEEDIAIDPDTEEEVYIRELEVENDKRLYDRYKNIKGLLQSHEIKRIREKYNLNQKDFAKVLGLGEITIHRYENGTIQTDATDSIIRFAAKPENMESVAYKNKHKLADDVFNQLMNRVTDLKLYNKHKIVELNNLEDFYRLSFETIHVEKLAAKVIELYNKMIHVLSKEYQVSMPKITNLELQKLLYYVQGICLFIYKEPAFKQNIYAWDYGPIVYEIYSKYKKYMANEIDETTDITVSEGLEKIIEIVIDGYGKYTGGQLIRMTHEEEPWLNTSKNKIIQEELIKEYFSKVYSC
jgi:putative zinc finger/helix-turn-helix YgiT family protein